jgi:exosome complex RNA-binding protein Csl4
MFIIGEQYYIKDDEGLEQKIHVDKSTKLDTVKVGDLVKAYVTDQGHTTTLQRAN